MKTITSLEQLADFTGLVLFSAPWCGPCKSYKPFLEQWAPENGRELVQVDVDANRDIAAKFAIRAVPTTVYFKDGKPLCQSTGAQTANALKLLCK